MLRSDLVNLTLRAEQLEVILLGQDETSDITPQKSSQLVRHSGWDGLLTSLVPFVSGVYKVQRKFRAGEEVPS